MNGLSEHLHIFFAKDLATPAIGLAIDGDAAFHADAHAAERSARLADDGEAKLGYTGRSQSRSDNSSRGHFCERVVYFDPDCVTRDGHNRLQIAQGSKVQAEWQLAGPAAGRRGDARCPKM